MTDKQKLIISSVDNALTFTDKYLQGFLDAVYKIPDYMVDSSKQISSLDWCFWKPMKANIDASEFEEYEKRTGTQLPESYIMFLSYKHFIDLNFGHDVIFFKHTKNWIPDNIETISRWGIETTLQKKLLPFADISDVGLVCFDAREPERDNEYNIVYIDHHDREYPQKFQHAHFSFIDLIKEMNNVLDKWRVAKINGN